LAKLTALKVKNAPAGRHADGLGLYLLVKPATDAQLSRGEKTGARSWLLRVQVDKRRRDIGLGSVTDLTLTEAREKAAELRKVARNGADPVLERDRDKRPAPTFKGAVDDAHRELSRGWTAKHAAAFKASLEEHAYPALKNIRVDHIEASTIRDALAPIWIEKPVIARKVRQRIGTVLNFAKSKGWRTTEAPTRSVAVGLSRQPKGKNFAALPYADVPALVKRVRAETVTVGRLALLFTILTAARSGEVRSARWSYIDFDAKLWRRPAELMKSREAHDVTLSDAAIEILREAETLRTRKGDPLIFEGKAGAAISDMTLTKVLRDMDVAATVHGFRSSFRDWAAEMMPGTPEAVAEAALAHAVPDATVRAYKRTTFLDMRRKLLDGWAGYLATVDGGNVRKLRA